MSCRWEMFLRLMWLMELGTSNRNLHSVIKVRRSGVLVPPYIAVGKRNRTIGHLYCHPRESFLVVLMDEEACCYTHRPGSASRHWT